MVYLLKWANFLKFKILSPIVVFSQAQNKPPQNQPVIYQLYFNKPDLYFFIKDKFSSLLEYCFTKKPCIHFMLTPVMICDTSENNFQAVIAQ